MKCIDYDAPMQVLAHTSVEELASATVQQQHIDVSANYYRANKHACNARKVIKSSVCMYLPTYNVIL